MGPLNCQFHSKDSISIQALFARLMPAERIFNLQIQDPIGTEAVRALNRSRCVSVVYGINLVYEPKSGFLGISTSFPEKTQKT